MIDEQVRLEKQMAEKLAAMYDTRNPFAPTRIQWADDGIAWVIQAINPLGDRCIAIDGPAQHVAPVTTA